MHLIRSASIANYETIARSFGLDPVDLIKKAGLDEECLTNPDLRIPIRKVDALLELSANKAGIDYFGLRLSETRSIANLGPIGLLLRDEADFHQFLESIRRYIHLHNDAVSVHVNWQESKVTISLQYNLKNWTIQRQSMELAIGVLYRSIQAYMGEGWNPRRVYFQHSSPKNPNIYIESFGAAVHFLQSFDGLDFVFSQDAVTRIANPLMARYARQYLETMIAGTDDHFIAELRNLVIMMLPTGKCSAEHISDCLDIECRTLQRRLSVKGTTFSEVLCSIRKDLATKYLSQSERTLAEIADLLGFSRHSAFSRWFKQQFGVTAHAWRLASQRSKRSKK